MPSPSLSGKTRMILGRIEILLKINTAFWLSGFTFDVGWYREYDRESLPGTKMFEDTEGLLVEWLRGSIFFFPILFAALLWVGLSQ
ncbi:hypothetical protein BBI15_07990 [Planococcus plakortidis]|uniref:Uncharacterized protein n=1 Tax=Planococcus plakortidis TaxID=1038856 RepID=A0A1C7E8V0_9BACL|nr:hypothetical protein BBI15_07990 [Planococcus plakortidis]